MPIYEYQCRDCGNRSEAMQRMGAPPLEVCENCGGALEKRFSAPDCQFKGSGWYVTDYAGKDGPKNGTKDDYEKKGGESEAKDSKSESSSTSSSDSPVSSSSDKSSSTSKTTSADD